MSDRKNYVVKMAIESLNVSLEDIEEGTSHYSTIISTAITYRMASNTFETDRVNKLAKVIETYLVGRKLYVVPEYDVLNLHDNAERFNFSYIPNK